MKLNRADWWRSGWSGLVLTDESWAGNGSTEGVSHQDCRQCLENTPYGSVHVVLSVYSVIFGCLWRIRGWVLRKTVLLFILNMVANTVLLFLIICCIMRHDIQHYPGPNNSSFFCTSIWTCYIPLHFILFRISWKTWSSFDILINFFVQSCF